MHDSYTLLELSKSVIARLSLLHTVDTTIKTGKNKLIINVNSYDFELSRSYDMVKDVRKTVCECKELEMFPVVLEPLDIDSYTERDVEEVSAAIDIFFIRNLLGLDPRLAICNKYYYLSKLFADLGYKIDLENYLAGLITPTEQGNLPSSDESSTIIIPISATEKASGQNKLLLAFLKDFEVEIFVLDYPINGCINSAEYDEESVKSYLFMHDYDFVESVKQFLHKYDNFKMLNAKIGYLKEEPKANNN